MEICGSAKVTAEKAINLGEKLAKLKGEIVHGRWLRYVKKNFDFCDRTAQRYMELAANKEALLAKFDSVSNFNLTDAYRIVASRKVSEQGQETPISEQSDDDKYSKSKIMTELTRDLINKLERLTSDQLVKFRVAVAEFKENWLKDNT